MALPKIPKPKVPKLVVPKADLRGMARRAIPAPIALFLLALTTGSVATFAHWIGGTKAVVAVAIIVAVVTLLGGLWSWLRKRRETQRSTAFAAGLQGTSAEHGLIGDPGEAARLDDLRQNFLGGIEKFREYGKDIYKLPWYVMVGEPGAGKTEAIRRSSIRFPEALQDKFQGVGGTYSMHWWFTNQAVLLDTAGAMLMGDQTARRFQSFLGLLREHRPDCPINGVILAIPVDRLLLDDETNGQEKAQRISQQMGVIQDALRMRFPIYVIITKSDKITGFREFCDAAGNDSYSRQMFGWSNPDDLDAPINSERIVRGMRSIVERVRRRRYALLRDPISTDPKQRRANQVDSLYALPEVLGGVIQRLQRYLEVLFSGGEWVNRPPFFRGVYFTSSMREGSALDRDLAAALAISPDKLPVGGVWERERSFFLRDLFLEKLFHEKGLVTSLMNTSQILRRKMSTLYAATAALLAGLLGIGWFFSHKIGQQMEKEEYIWQAANREWHNGTFLPVVAPIPGKTGLWRFQSQRKISWAGREWKLMTYLEELRLNTLPGLAGALLFRPLASFRALEKDRAAARRIVIEGSLVKPVIDAAREKLSLSNGTADANEVAALAALIRLERALANHESLSAEEISREIHAPLFHYITGEKPRDDLAGLLDNCYGPNGTRLDSRAWTSSGLNLTANIAIAHGLDRFLGWRTSLKEGTEAAIARRADWLTKAFAFQAEEDRLLEAINGRSPFREARNVLGQLNAAKAALDKLLASQRPAQTNDGPEFQAGVARLRKALGPPPSEATEEYLRWHRDLSQRWEGKLSDLGKLPPLATAEQKVLDENIGPPEAAERPYVARVAHYEKATKLGGDVAKADLIGGLAAAIKKIGEMKGQGAPAMTYVGPRKDVCEKIGTYLHGFADQQPLVGLLEAYRVRLLAQLNNQLLFPLVIDSAKTFEDTKDLMSACAVIEKVWEDFAAPEYQAIERDPNLGTAMADMRTIRQGIEQLRIVATAMQKAGQPKLMELSLVPLPSEALGSAPPPPEPPKPKPKKEKKEKKDKEAEEEEAPEPEPPPPTAKPGVVGVSVFDRLGTALVQEEPPGSKMKSLGQLPIDDGIKVEVLYFPEGSLKPAKQSTGNEYQTQWGCLRLALRHLSERGGNKVLLPFGKVSLELKFADLLPSRKDWPRRAGILGQ